MTSNRCPSRKMLCIKRGYAFWGDAIREGGSVMFFLAHFTASHFSVLNAAIVRRLVQLSPA